jgi:hypothetical protein
MRCVALRAGAAFVLGLGLAALPVVAEDSKPMPDVAPSFTGYVYITDVVGEVVKASDSSVTLRITWFESKPNAGRRNLGGNHRNFRNPFTPHMNRPQGQVKEAHHDYVLEYLPQSLVRTKSLPVKLDENGKKTVHTQKEIDELRAPSVVTGYAASRSDVVPGTYLEVILIRDKHIAAEKATENDLRIKYAIIHGHDPNPPKDVGGGSGSNDKNAKKKN